jgi:hypothetical protein
MPYVFYCLNIGLLGSGPKIIFADWKPLNAHPGGKLIGGQLFLKIKIPTPPNPY